jgi:hypothetical protein
VGFEVSCFLASAPETGCRLVEANSTSRKSKKRKNFDTTVEEQQ